MKSGMTEKENPTQSWNKLLWM